MFIIKKLNQRRGEWEADPEWNKEYVSLTDAIEIVRELNRRFPNEGRKVFRRVANAPDLSREDLRQWFLLRGVRENMVDGYVQKYYGRSLDEMNELYDQMHCS